MLLEKKGLILDSLSHSLKPAMTQIISQIWKMKKHVMTHCLDEVDQNVTLY